MAFSRRFFLVGGSGLISAGFVKDAIAAIADTEKPLLIGPKNPAQELFSEWTEDGWRLHLGMPTFDIPPAPLWIDHLKECGHELETAKQIIEYCDDSGFEEDDLWKPVDGFGWEDYWEYSGSPEAKAFELLDSAKVFPKLRNLRQEGSLVFQSFPNPMSSARWVEAPDPLSLSLLQAQLNGLDLDIAIKELPADRHP